MKIVFGALLLAAVTTGALVAADPLSVEISNGQLKARVYVPDTKNGFYRSTRFDWSGMIASLEYKGHVFYGPWFYKIDHSVYDFDYDASGVVVEDTTAAVGPAEEFNTDGTALGFAAAQPGGTFVKIGIGVLRKPAAGAPPDPPRPSPPPGRGTAGRGPQDPDRYDHSRAYVIVDPGKWITKKSRDSLESTQELNDPADGYSYVYRKTIRLLPDEPKLVIEHSLRNTGSKPIRSTVYNHNFFTLDKEGPSEGLTITVPYQIQSQRPPTQGLLEAHANQLVYVKTLLDKDRATATLGGFGDTAKDYDFRVENKKLGAGYHVTADRPPSNVALWSIRTVMAVEPYIAMSIDPGKEFTWMLTYDYFTTK
jgi:hypothetical protein